MYNTKVIFKHKLEGDAKSTIYLPNNSQILKFDVQNYYFYIWVLQDTITPFQTARTFQILATGEEFDYTPNHKYINTIQHDNYVWHLFELT